MTRTLRLDLLSDDPKDPNYRIRVELDPDAGLVEVVEEELTSNSPTAQATETKGKFILLRRQARWLGRALLQVAGEFDCEDRGDVRDDAWAAVIAGAEMLGLRCSPEEIERRRQLAKEFLDRVSGTSEEVAAVGCRGDDVEPNGGSTPALRDEDDEICDECGGTGWEYEPKIACAGCGGTGKMS